MKIISTTGATSVVDPEHGTFTADESGAVDVPEELGRTLVGLRIEGQVMWETEDGHNTRLANEDLAKRRDPASLLAAVDALSEKIDAQQRVPMTARELRDAENERRRIEAERQADADAAIAAAEAAEQKAVDAEADSIAAEAERIAALHVHVGDEVRFTEDATAEITAAAEAEGIEPVLPDPLGIVIAVYTLPNDDAPVDVADVSATDTEPAGYVTVPIDRLEVVAPAEPAEAPSTDAQAAPGTEAVADPEKKPGLFGKKK